MDQQIQELEKADEGHPVQVFIQHLFEAGAVDVGENSISLWEDETRWKLLANYFWSEGILYLNLDPVTWNGWFDLATAKRFVEEFDKRTHVKVALPIGRFMDPVAGRFVKDLVASEDTFNGLDKIRLNVADQLIEWSWFEGHVVRDEEHLGHTSYFTIDVARFLLAEWTDRE